MGLTGCKNFEDMFNRFDIIPACDRRADKLTEMLHQYQACIRECYWRY